MISIITPCKNIILEGREVFFRKMMNTLKNQTYQNFEHIVVDSDSKDGTIKLLQEYVKLGQIDQIISEKDNNLHEALNKGIKLARGKFIYIMNTDDYFSTNTFFEKSLKAINLHKVDFTHGNRIIVKRDGSKQSIKFGDENVAFFRMPFRWQTMLIKKSVYDEIGPLDESYEIAADYKFMMQMLLLKKRGFYFSENLIYSLDGGITKDRQKCVDEVTRAIYETYGKRYNLTMIDCKNIYLRNISPKLYKKICLNVKNKKILDSLKYCYKIIQKVENNKNDDFSFPRAPLENFSYGLCNIEIPELGKKENGKIRNSWDVICNSDTLRVIVTSDIQYAFVRPICAVPGKGQVSNLISAYWCKKTQDIIANHLIAIPHPNVTIARKAKIIFPIEVVVRRYMAKSNSPTSIYYNYTNKKRRIIYGIKFPEGLIANQELPMGNIVTPTTKSENGHDEEITCKQAKDIVDKIHLNGTWDNIQNAALKIFERARLECLSKGLILADTKFEFGLDMQNNLMLVDEVLTPDGSRYWLAKNYNKRLKTGKDLELSKDILRSELLKKGFTGHEKVPIISKNLINKLSAIHTIPYTIITGKTIDVRVSDENKITRAVINYLKNNNTKSKKTKLLK